MKQHWKKIAAGAGALLLLILMFLYLTGSLSREPKVAPGRKEAEAKPAAGMETAQVVSATIPLEVEAVGTVDAREAAQVSSRTMAVIVKMNASSGDRVKAGETLVELDARDAQAQLSQAKESLASARASLERAKLDAGRMERLYEKQAATKQEYDSAQAALKIAQAQVDAAKARVREAEVFLSYTKIDSPIDGYVIDRLADPGDMAVPGQPLLSIYVPASLRLEVIVPERLRSNVHVGQTVEAAIDALDLRFEGQIAQIVPSFDVSSRSFLVRVPIPDDENAYPGMYGRIWIPMGTTEAILVPPEAVWQVGQLEMVNVVKDGVARTRTIKTGKTYPEGLEVLAGLEPGEVVAVSQQEVHE